MKIPAFPSLQNSDHPESWQDEAQVRGSCIVAARLVAAAGFLLAAIGVTAWGLASGGNVHARPVRLPHSSASPVPKTIALSSLIPHRWKLAFDPSFAGSQFDTKVWDTCYPWATNFAVGCSNFGHKEWEWYMPGQDRVSHGLLELVAQMQPTIGIGPSGKRLHYNCRSGIVTTYHSFQFEYGAVQVVAQMPRVGGMWPALWLAASDQKYPPEIDIVEHWVRPTHRTGVFLHPVHVNGTRPWNFLHTANLGVGFHTFSLVWTYHQIEWLIDGKIALIVHHGIPHESMYFIADLASAKRPSKGGCGGALAIKSVKIWVPPKR